MVAVDHGPNRLGDEVVSDAAQKLMEELAVEALQVAMVKTVARIGEGDAGKVICKEAERLKPAAVVMGTRGRGLLQRCWRGIIGVDLVKQEASNLRAVSAVRAFSK
ncbi:hypothetical protein AKJ16_DCAP18835 [Drosera capensis]